MCETSLNQRLNCLHTDGVTCWLFPCWL